MGKTRKIAVLCAEADRERLAPILEKLRARGVGAEETEAPQKGEVVLAALSKGFFADGACVDRLLGLLGAGAENVLPLLLDAAPIPDKIKNALYARNIIPADGRDDDLIAERIAAALPQKKSRLPLILSAAALVLIAAAGLLFWRNQTPPPPPVTPTPAVETPEPTPGVRLPGGMTEEDLALVVETWIVGDKVYPLTREDKEAGVQFPATTAMVESEMQWYSKEDGHRLQAAAYEPEDLEFLRLLPNMESLLLGLVDCERLPDLGGLEKLRSVDLIDCGIRDIGCLRGAKASSVGIYRCPVENYEVLNSCEKLTSLWLEFEGIEEADLSRLAPPALREALIRHAPLLDVLDLSGLEACSRLKSLDLYQVPVRDLSFLNGLGSLETLRMYELYGLRDVSPLRDLSSLRELEIENCRGVADYSAVGGCTGLQSLLLRAEGDDPVFDASVLAELPSLTRIELQNFTIPNLDFLNDVGSRHKSASFSYAGTVYDFSGLAGVTVYDYLSLDPDDGATLAQMAPYLQDAEIGTLALRRMNTVDLSLLPNVTEALTLDRCGLRDLSGLPEGLKFMRLELQRMTRLSSLEGIQTLVRFNNGVGTLQISDCPRLGDWSALDGLRLHALEITCCFSLPSLENVSLSELRLDSIADLEDLSILDGLDDSRAYRLAFVGLDGVTSLAPASRLHGYTLTVGPQLAEQAADLVEEQKFREYRVEYPDHGWELDDDDLVLLSLDELETLPKALLRHISRVCLVGDRVYDPGEYEYSVDGWQRDALDRPALFLQSRETGEEERMEYGTIEDLSVFADLTGLQQLQLDGQIFSSLDGVQNLSSLRCFRATQCYALTDASALFSMEDLEEVNLSDTRVESIQGIQNLSRLRSLDLSRTPVSDLSPLAECDFTAACENGGVDMNLNELPLTEADFAALGTIRRFCGLAFTDADPAVWIPALAGSEILYFGAAGDLRSDEDLAALCAGHPELRSIWIGYAEGITDLTPLLALEDLEEVSVHRDMAQAIASLEGQEIGFRLNIQDW